MGAIANGHGSARWAFAIGACVASVLWFAALGHGAQRLAPLFAAPRAWKILDGVVAVVMLTMGGILIASV
ncbi:putative amino acid transporter [Gordonia soli NBRC 108243]|uniref:Putative amino acid transporter n=1 Tax=Gordonia soli NBRC 108243 TaxID=1223545 RepID=M0QFI1_9ACTN|nr:putative amino acid transporter [Gordonia soli NBRC 108243]